ncbi:ABC transporter ATP-binding protein [Fusibacter sp. JL216-2]|uniref:ABC transporter ATP-binding protein n=1 Tax=Fusibacter sp. JL216-2 TaxID=3071453 RepID=UPI003D346162
MNQNIHEEQKIEKSFDIDLFKRLFKFTRPYLPVFIICILLLFFITAVDLVRPYLIKVVIDDYINAWEEPMVSSIEALPHDPDKLSVVKYNDQYFVRESELRTYIQDDFVDYLKSQDPEKGQDIEKALKGLSPGSAKNDSKDRSLAEFLNPLKENGVTWAQFIDPEMKYQLFMHEGNQYLTGGVIPSNADIDTRQIENNILYADEDLIHLTTLTEDDYHAFRVADINGIMKVIMTFVIILVGGFLLNYLQALLLNYAAQRQIYEMRQALFNHLMHQSLSFFDKNPVGRLVTRVTNDMKNISDMYTNVLINAFKDVLLLGGTIFVMFALNAKLALVSLITFPLIGLAAWRFRMKAREAHRAVKVKIAKINSALSENISGMKIIQIFDQQAAIKDAFKKVNDEHLEVSLDEIRVFAIFRPTMNLIYSLTLAILIWYGGGKALQGALELGVLFAFINYTEQFYRPIFDLSEKFNILQSAMASAERIFLLFDTNEGIEEVNAPIRLEPFRGEIEFKNVWFSYDEDNWVLKDVSFKVEPGDTVAFVGATGSGKTTIISLLNRFYDIQKGQILVDGFDIKTLSLDDLRGKIGMVLQDVFLFAGDIKGNIRLNQRDMPMECLESVARHVNADPFIKKLPGGYDEPVQERGSTLSAGQRQLLSFARALAFNPDVLILDEATANIDTETEQLIQDAIDKVVRDRTTIVVAHRLSTIQNSDKIIVLHKGEIREVGTHDELLSHEGIYHNLFQLQYK